jgi:hypothetical protein
MRGPKSTVEDWARRGAARRNPIAQGGPAAAVPPTQDRGRACGRRPMNRRSQRLSGTHGRYRRAPSTSYKMPRDKKLPDLAGILEERETGLEPATFSLEE